MSKYGEMSALLDTAFKLGKNSRNDFKEPRRERKETVIDDIVKRFLEDQLRKSMGDMADKLNKKDDKPKTGWEGYSTIKKVSILTTTVPLATMGMILTILAFCKIVAKVWGM
jgi:methyl coenzyme M reductase beta subunit